MSKKTVLRFTLKELNGLIQDEKSRVILQRCIRKIPLQPYCLNDLHGSIHEELDANLAKFDRELKGILLSYKNVKIVKDVANMLHDDSRLYVTIQADFYLFMPEVGRVLRGVVNKRSADHIGCLVHKAFNVSIPRPECEVDGDWKGYYVEIGQEVTFRVESLDLTGSLPYMLGCLLDVGSVARPSSENSVEGESKGKLNSFLEPHDHPEESLSVVERKKKHKHKKNAGLENQASMLVASFMEYGRRDSNLKKGEEKYHNNEICKTNDVENNVSKVGKKKKRKYTEEHREAINQEEDIFKLGDKEHSINYPDPYAEQQEEYQEQLTDNIKHIDVSLHSASQNNFSSSPKLKKKKRKYSEAFQGDKLDYEEPISMLQDESSTTSKPKKKRNKLVAEMSYADEEYHSIDTSQKNAVENNNNNKKDKLVEEMFCAEIEDHSINTSQEITREKKKKKKEKLVEEMEEINYAEPEDQSIETLEDVTKCKKKKKKEKLFTEMSNVESEWHSIDTSQEVTQEKTKKKKKKFSEDLRDETLVDGIDDPSYSITWTTMPHNKGLAQSRDSNNVSEKMESEISLDKEYFKKTSKKIKSNATSDCATSTPVEYRNVKDNSAKVSKTSKKLVYLQQLKLSPVKVKCLKNEREIENNAHPFMVKLLKKDNNVPCLESENVTKYTNIQSVSSDAQLSSLQRREFKYKKEQYVEKSNQPQIKNDLEQSLKSKSKLNNRETAIIMHKKASRRTVQENSNVSGGISDSQDDNSDCNHIHQSVHTHPGSSKTGRELSRIAESATEIKKNPPTRNGSVSTANETLKVAHEMNIKEKNISPSRTPSENTGKQNENTGLSHSHSFSLQNLDRACSSDSGLSLSVTSGERESGSSALCGQTREASSPCSSGDLPIVMPRTPKRKRISSPEGNSGQCSVKKIKKEKGNHVTMPSSSQQSNAVGSSEEDNSLEAEKMKLLAAMVKKLEGGNKKDSSIKHEHHTHREKRKSTQEEALLGINERSSPSSKDMQRRKQNNKDCSTKNNETMQKLDAAGQSIDFFGRGSTTPTTDPVVGNPLTNQVQLLGRIAKTQSNVSSEEEYSPVRLKAEVLERTPKRKSYPGVENSKVKYTLKKEHKIKIEKESPKKSEMSLSSNTEDLKSLEEETPDAIADRLLQEFIKRRSLC